MQVSATPPEFLQATRRCAPAWRHPILRWLRAALLMGAAALAGCAVMVEPPTGRSDSQALPASASSPLGRVAAQAGLAEGESGLQPISQASHALDARIELIRRARASIDLQYYLIGNDATGRLLLRELRDAALRGVRVRLLLDDMYTDGMDPLLLALASYPNAQVRVFNPFFGAGRSSPGRLVSLATDFSRLNHRMHNKLFLADSAFAVAGGRNIADEYFLRSQVANFLDLDVLLVGAVVPQLSSIFDRYWNSGHAYAIQQVTAVRAGEAELRAGFDLETGASAAYEAPAGLDANGLPALGRQLDAGALVLVHAPVAAFADDPQKVGGAAASGDLSGTATHRFLQAFREARSEVLVYSPYFVPGRQGMAQIREARDHGIAIRVVTNSLASSDVPLASYRYQQYREELLRMGAELYEISSPELMKDDSLKRVLGRSQARLHAKLAVVDRRTVLLGSVNMDPRSARTNTELGLQVSSPQFAAAVLNLFRAEGRAGALQVRLAPDGRQLEWYSPASGQTYASDPEGGALNRMRLYLMSLFVPESLL
jgi:putative cardiolipin synthase